LEKACIFGHLSITPDFVHKFILRHLTIFAGLLVGSALLAESSGPERSTGPETRWTMINVSPREAQADCHLIEFPDGRKALVDIGDGADAPGNAIGYLQSRKITRIDLVVLSHFHKDHYGRLPDLIAAGIEVGKVAGNMPAAAATGCDSEMPWGFDRKHAESVLQLLREKHIPYFTPKAGERLIEVRLPDGGSVALDVVCLYDGATTPVGKTDTNDTSIIVRLSHGPTRALFTGDLNSKLGSWLAKSTFDLRADILKAPHHGTEGCAPNEFFARVNPKATLVPAPKNLWLSNRSKRIRDYFAAEKIPAYVSGINGNVTVTLTESGFTIQSEHPE
jgi:competence protein ComEC